MHVNVIVAFSAAAYHEATGRHGAYDIVLTWEEVVALAGGLRETTTGADRLGRLREGLRFFAERQGLTFTQGPG